MYHRAVRARGGCGTRGLGAVLTWDSCLAVSPIVTSFSWANLLYMVVAHHLSVVRGCIRLTVRCPTLLNPLLPRFEGSPGKTGCGRVNLG